MGRCHLFGLVQVPEPFLVSSLLHSVKLSLSRGVHFLEVSRAPFLIREELVWASELIPVLLGVLALVERVSGLEAHLPVEVVESGVTDEVALVLKVGSRH